jgi:peptide/nickel transport system permease protein
MAAFILRRLGVLGVILFGSSFILYNLAAISADPLEQLKFSTDPNRDFLIASLTRELQLDVPPPARYFLWLKGILGIFIGKPDFGTGRDGSLVIDSLALAIPVTIRLVLAATIFAIILGIAIGVITALRQYSRFDYSMTFVAFLLFSLPVFWVAVLLKEYMAIQFNNFLQNPTVPIGWIIGVGAVTGIFWGSILGGDRRKFWISFVTSAAIASSLLTVISITGWFANPQLGPIVITLLAVGIAFGITQISVGISNRAALKASLTSAALVSISYFPVNWLFDKYPNSLTIFLLASLNIAIAVFVALGFSKIDRGPIVRTTVITAFVASGLLFVDKLMQTWKPYMETDAVNYRPVPTVGQRSDLLGTEDWC